MWNKYKYFNYIGMNNTQKAKISYKIYFFNSLSGPHTLSLREDNMNCLVVTDVICDIRHMVIVSRPVRKHWITYDDEQPMSSNTSRIIWNFRWGFAKVSKVPNLPGGGGTTAQLTTNVFIQD